MKTYTPGPWGFKKIPIWTPLAATELIPIFEFDSDGGPEWIETAKANARLIGAAPELLDACRVALCNFQHCTNKNSKEGWEERTFDLLRSAISKAAGK